MNFIGKQFYLIVLVFFTCNPGDKTENNRKPLNILLIVADDLGYTDLGAFGGDISTPNLDSLAAQGLTFSRFHTAPMCAVTRAMLLSGNDNHIAGMGSQDLKTSEFGYEGHLSDRIIPLPQILRKAGYHTYIAGKWHLGNRPEDDPNKKGFEHSFVLIEGGGNHYNHMGIFPTDTISPYTENGIKTDWPDGAYSTDFYTNKLISYIDLHKSDRQPFFAFAAYTTPHWPLQVDPEYWQKYEGKYEKGYESLRKERFENQKQLGLIPPDAELPELSKKVKPWDSLKSEQKKKESRKMELYAGMVDNMDVNIGRLISYLKEIDQFENTLIIFFSDNGAAAADFYNHDYFGPFLKRHYSDAYEDMGTAESFISYGPQWAEAGTSPFKYFKGYTTQGGINTPLIISGPSVESKGSITHSFATLMDIAPTLYQLTGIKYPNTDKINGLYPLKGESLVPTLNNYENQVHDKDYVFALEHRGHVIVRKGDWKLINSIIPHEEDNFELYDLSKDLAEQKNLRYEHPEKYSELYAEWLKYKDDVKVQIPTPRP